MKTSNDCTALVPVKNLRVGKVRVKTPRGVTYVDTLREARKVALKGLAPGETAVVNLKNAVTRPWSCGTFLRTFYYVPGGPGAEASS